jgi:hypothetical protein
MRHSACTLTGRDSRFLDPFNPSMRRIVATLLLSIPQPMDAQDSQLERSVRQVYGHVLIARAAQRRFDAKQAAAVAANDSVVAAWLMSAGIPALERVGRERFPTAMAGAESDVRRFQGVVNLTVKMAEQKYTSLAEFLLQAMPWTKYESELARLRPLMGGTAVVADVAAPPDRERRVAELPSPASPPATHAPAVSSAASMGRGDVDGVYLRRVTRMGYGGMMVIEFEPFVLFTDGSVFVDPSGSLETLDRAQSRAAEPHAWGKVMSREGTSWQVRMQAVKRVKDDLDRKFVGVYRLTTARSGQSLDGEYRSLGGTGNVAMGGNAAVVVENRWAFSPDGRFARGGFAGATNSGVATGSPRATKTGRYRVDGYAIELQYDAGATERWLFGLDATGGLVVLGETVYSLRRR